jgi:hypothetical protein
VKLKHSIPNDKYQLVVSTEQDVGEEIEINIPTFECIGVLRQQGRIGVVKATNVEIHELGIKLFSFQHFLISFNTISYFLESIGVAKGDTSELSDMIRY